MRKILLLSLALSACLGAAVVCVLLWPDETNPFATSENFGNLQAGMTLPEVEANLGRPSGDQTTPDYEHRARALQVGRGAFQDYRTWRGEHITICVYLHEDQVVSVECYQTPSPSFTNRIKDWLRLPWW